LRTTGSGLGKGVLDNDSIVYDDVTDGISKVSGLVSIGVDRSCMIDAQLAEKKQIR
jgi:hypothetical protein